MSKISIAVIGAGRFGKVHIQRLAVHPLFKLISVVDTCPQARSWANLQGFHTTDKIETIIPHIEAAVVAVPSNKHAEVALSFIEKGIHLLIEKPLATTHDEIHAMMQASAKSDSILCTGHVERFMRDFSAVKLKPNKIKFQRYSSAQKSSAEAALDLIVHDLDLAAMLLKIDPQIKFDIIGTKIFDQRVEVAARVEGVELEFFAGYGVKHSYSDINLYYKDSSKKLYKKISSEDPISKQYNAFYDAIRLKKHDLIADVQAGAAAALRAIQVVASL